MAILVQLSHHHLFTPKSVTVRKFEMPNKLGLLVAYNQKAINFGGVMFPAKTVAYFGYILAIKWEVYPSTPAEANSDKANLTFVATERITGELGGKTGSVETAEGYPGGEFRRVRESLIKNPIKNGPTIVVGFVDAPGGLIFEKQTFSSKVEGRFRLAAPTNLPLPPPKNQYSFDGFPDPVSNNAGKEVSYKFNYDQKERKLTFHLGNIFGHEILF